MDFLRRKKESIVNKFSQKGTGREMANQPLFLKIFLDLFASHLRGKELPASTEALKKQIEDVFVAVDPTLQAEKLWDAHVPYIYLTATLKSAHLGIKNIPLTLADYSMDESKLSVYKAFLMAITGAWARVEKKGKSVKATVNSIDF